MNLKTLEVLHEAGLLRSRSDNDYRMARYDWLFPLYPLELFPVTVKEEDLRDAQRNWSFDGY